MWKLRTPVSPTVAEGAAWLTFVSFQAPQGLSGIPLCLLVSREFISLGELNPQPMKFIPASAISFPCRPCAWGLLPVPSRSSPILASFLPFAPGLSSASFYILSVILLWTLLFSLNIMSGDPSLLANCSTCLWGLPSGISSRLPGHLGCFQSPS